LQMENQEIQKLLRTRQKVLKLTSNSKTQIVCLSMAIYFHEIFKFGNLLEFIRHIIEI